MLSSGTISSVCSLFASLCMGFQLYVLAILLSVLLGHG